MARAPAGGDRKGMVFELSLYTALLRRAFLDRFLDFLLTDYLEFLYCAGLRTFWNCGALSLWMARSLSAFSASRKETHRS